MVQPAHSFELVVPPFFEWLARFEAEERAMFYQELFQAIAQAFGAGQWDEAAGLIEDWHLTAEGTNGHGITESSQSCTA